MDEPQQRRITEGAGLEESRINQDFVDFLRKWSSPVLFALAAVFGGMWVYQRVQTAQIDKINRGFATLEASLSSEAPDPRSLRETAEEFDGVRAVGELARLAAADSYLISVRTGLRPGAVLGENGEPAAEDVLSVEDRSFMIEQARLLYRAVLDATRNDPGKRLTAVSAAFGLAACAGSEGTPADAVEFYEQAASLAETGNFPILAEVARGRIERIRAGLEVPVLLNESALPPLPTPEPVAPMEMPGGLELDSSIRLTPPTLDEPAAAPADEPDADAGDE